MERRADKYKDEEASIVDVGIGEVTASNFSNN